jgi:hypothetical protein
MEPRYDTLLGLLLAYGFSEEFSRRALAAAGTTSFEAILDWIQEETTKEPASSTS